MPDSLRKGSTRDSRVEAAALVIAHADGYEGSDIVPSDLYRHQARKVLAAADRVVTDEVDAAYNTGYLDGLGDGLGDRLIVTDEMVERAQAALFAEAQRQWGWGNDEYEDVVQAVDVVLRAALGVPDA